MILNSINITIGFLSNFYEVKYKTIIKSPDSQPIWLLIQVVSLGIALTLAFLYFTCYIFLFLITFNLKQIIQEFSKYLHELKLMNLIDECISEGISKIFSNQAWSIYFPKLMPPLFFSNTRQTRVIYLCVKLRNSVILLSTKLFWYWKISMMHIFTGAHKATQIS